MRIQLLVRLGMSPSIVGSWGFYLKSMGIEKMCRHWRYCIARWGAYPVTWYLAFENDLPYYLSTTGKEDADRTGNASGLKSDAIFAEPTRSAAP